MLVCAAMERAHIRSWRESVARTVRFNIDHIVSDDIQELAIEEAAENPNSPLHRSRPRKRVPGAVGRTVAKLKEHLTDIYRAFIREGWLELRFNGELLSYVEPRVLRAAYFRNKDGPEREWRKPINFDFGDGLSPFAASRHCARQRTLRAPGFRSSAAAA